MTNFKLSGDELLHLDNSRELSQLQNILTSRPLEPEPPLFELASTRLSGGLSSQASLLARGTPSELPRVEVFNSSEGNISSRDVQGVDQRLLATGSALSGRSSNLSTINHHCRSISSLERLSLPAIKSIADESTTTGDVKNPADDAVTAAAIGKTREEMRKEAKREQNRRAAIRCRKRRAERGNELRQRIQELQKQKGKLLAELTQRSALVRALEVTILHHFAEGNCQAHSAVRPQARTVQAAPTSSTLSSV